MPAPTNAELQRRMEALERMVANIYHVTLGPALPRNTMTPATRRMVEDADREIRGPVAPRRT